MKTKTFAGLALGLSGTLISVFEGLRLRSVSISITQFGFGDYLSALFWIGFVMLLLGAYLVIRSDNDLSYLIVLFMIAIVMYNMPFLAEELPRDFDAYWHMSNATWIAENSFLSFSSFKIYTRLAYLQYPALFLYTATITFTTTLNALTILEFYPLFVTSIFVLNFYVLARALLGRKHKAFLATLFALIANGAMFSNHFSPSATAEAFFPLMIFMAVRGETAKKMRARYLIGLLPLSFSFILLHAIMPLLFSALLLSFCLFPHLGIEHAKRSTSRLAFASLVLLVMAMYFFWGMQIANYGFTQFAETLTSFLNLGKPVLATTIMQRQVLIFPLIGWLKRGIFFLFTVPALIVSIAQFLKKNLTIVHVTFLSVFVIWFISSLVTALSDRVLVWVVPFAALVLASTSFNILQRNLNLQRLVSAVLLLALLLIPPLTFATFYSDEATYVMTKAEYRGFEYLVNLPMNVGSVCGGVNSALYFFRYTAKDYAVTETPKDAGVIYFPSSLYAWYYWTEGNGSNTYTKDFSECSHDPTLNLVFSDGDFTIFSRKSS